MPPQELQQALYLDVRRGILSHKFAPGERIVTKTFSDGTGLTNSATVGVLNALATDGYLTKHQRSYTVATWSLENVLECTDRLEVFVETCAARVIIEKGPRLETMQHITAELMDTDPLDETFYLLAMEWFRELFGAGDRQMVASVAHRLIPQAYHRIVWLLLTAAPNPGKIVRKIVAANLEWLEGGLRGFRKRQVGIFEELRRAYLASVSADPAFRFDEDQLAGRMEVREPDVRGRLLALSHPFYPLLLPADRSPGAVTAITV